MPLNIAATQAELQQLTVGQLRQRYAALFQEQTRSGNRIWLIKRILWRLQANQQGALSDRARQQALALANDADLRLKAPKQQTLPNCTKRQPYPVVRHQSLPLPGALLTRRYKGQDHHVTVLEEGFEYRGERYASLTAIAKVITGSHWSGHRFFGLQRGARQ
jgi:hypothetical protein